MRFGRTPLLVVVAVLVTFIDGIVPSSAAPIHACAKKQNGQLRLVASTADCLPSEEPATWSSEGVKTISGLVGANGEQFIGSGFTVARLNTGVYRISFPAGTWSAFPVMVVSPFGLPGAFPVAEIGTAIGFGDGSAFFEVLISSTAGPFTPLDAAFWFIVTAS